MKQLSVPAEPYFAERRKDPEYVAAYHKARDRIARFDAVMRALDARREELGMSKAELARRADMQPEAVRRLFSMKGHNPTLATIVALADALDLDVGITPRRHAVRASSRTAAASAARSGTAETRLPDA